MNICAWRCKAKKRTILNTHFIFLTLGKGLCFGWDRSHLFQTLFKSHFPMVMIITRPLDSLSSCSFGLA